MSSQSGEYEELHFTGESANEAEDFIQAVNKRAYAAGKQKDNAWIAEFAYPFFSRKALRWYETLGEEIQNDWKLLKRAILVEYCGEQPSPSTVPFAAPASFSLVPAAPPPSISAAAAVGRIRVDCEDNRYSGYLYVPTSGQAMAIISANRSTCSIFEADVSGRTFRLQSREEHLVVKTSSPGWSFNPGRNQYGYVSASSKPSEQGPQWGGVWSIASGGSITASFLRASGDRCDLEFLSSAVGERTLFVTGNNSEFLRAYGVRLYKPVTLHFEGFP